MRLQRLQLLPSIYAQGRKPLVAAAAAVRRYLGMTTLHQRTRFAWHRLAVHGCYAMVVVAALVGAAATLVAAGTSLTAALFTAWLTYLAAVGFYLLGYRLSTGPWDPPHR